MYRKLIYLVPFVVVLGMVGNANGQSDTGNILFEYWFDFAGNRISNLTDDPRYPDNPDQSELREKFDGQIDWRDHYGVRARGFLYPPADGDYSFWVSGDDYCELWLSTNDDPDKVTIIAEVPGWATYLEWSKYPQQKSKPITLAAGQKYYIEALMKENDGGDSLTVGWGGPTIGTGPVIIDGAYLSPWLGWFKAYEPVPADDAIHQNTWVQLSWQPGSYAVSNDVYFGDNFDNVNDGIAEAFVGNQVATFLVVGFPGFHYPEGLIPGTKYYWRVDDVEADGTTKYKGYVWSFMVPSKTAYDPIPPEDTRFVDPNVELSWTAGFSARLHTVHFGDNFDDVNNATGGLPQGTLTYSPGPLEFEKTYYWRIDEFDTVATHKGDVWSFTTARAGGGVRADYYKGMDLKRLVLTRIDPQINFNWSIGEPDPLVGNDRFSVRWTGEVEAAYTETYTFYTNSADGIRLWVDDKQLVDNWTDHANTQDSGTIDLIEGQVYSIVMEMYENDGDAVAQLRWESPRTPKQFIPQAALSLPVKTSSPSPSNGAIDVKHTSILKWGAGDAAVSHQVYFSTDEDAVKNANTGSPEYKGTKDLGSESYDPGKLPWDTTYYWRVDEVNNLNPESPWVGNLWSFTTANFLVVDDFEDYNIGDNEIWWAWRDGVGYASHPTEPPYAGNGTGSMVGDETTDSTTKETIVHGGNQSMPLFYDNNQQLKAKYSEAELTLTYPRDWTEEGVKTLTIWFRGNPAAFTEAPAGTYTMSASGADIYDAEDQFRYAYKQLSGAGSISAQVLSVQNTDGWAKAGVMIRETLEPGSKHAFICITPINGVASQGRTNTNASSFNVNQTRITAPHWVKLERSDMGSFTGYHSADGVIWEPIQGDEPRLISMSPNVYIGLALTSHNVNATCLAEFSNVQTTGAISPLMWTNQAVGSTMTANDPEPMHVALNGSAVVYHDNPNAALINTWTQWNIDLQAFADQGVNLVNVNAIALGFGDKNNPQTGGSGTVYFDDIRLYPPPPEPAP
ncbi:MAG: PA14 domain-containing protein [Planctomycetota bacterium]|jgi:hypothetical protein